MKNEKQKEVKVTIHSLKLKKSTLLNKRGKEVGDSSFELEVREAGTMKKIKSKSVKEHQAEYGKSLKKQNRIDKGLKAKAKHRNHIKTIHEKRKFRGEERKIQIISTKVGEIVVPPAINKAGKVIRKSFIKPQIEVNRIFHRGQ